MKKPRRTKKSKQKIVPQMIINDKTLNNWDGLKELIGDDDIFEFYIGVIMVNMEEYHKMKMEELKLITNGKRQECTKMG